MRANTRRVTKLILSFSLLSFLAVVFQNCAGYSAASNPLYDEEDYTGCLGYNCETDSEAIEIRLGSPVAYLTKTGPASTGFDVSGYCDTAGHAGSIFYAQLYKGVNAVENERRYPTVNCSETGRFRFLYTLPGGYDLNSGYTLKVRMTVIDETGQEFDNPRRLNINDLSVPPAT